MNWRMKTLVEVAEGALSGMDNNAFTSREFGEVLHESQQHLRPHERYHKPLRRGHTAGHVLARLRDKGLVIKCGPRSGGSWWQRA